MILKNVNPKLSLSPKVAVVGSSGRLLKTKHGKKIDSYDDVIRFNRAPTKGWEKHCGSKTTLRVLNHPTFVNAPLKRWKDNQYFVKNLKNQRLLVYGITLGRIKERDEHTHSSNKIYCLSDYKKLTSKYGLPSDPTAGFSTIVCLIESGITPHLFGMDFEPRPRDHYWHERPGTSVCHDISAEMKLLKNWKTKKKVVIYK